MHEPNEFEALRRETTSWWWVSRRKLLREAVSQAVNGKREARVLDVGCAGELESANPAVLRAVNVHSMLPVLAFHQMQGRHALICSSLEELSFGSNSFDAVVAGDILQAVSDDVAVLREMRRVLKDGASLCLTVPAYPALWGERDEAAGHRRRYTANELRRKLNNAGFEVTRVSYLVASGFLPSFIERIAKNIFTKSIDRYGQSARRSPTFNATMVLLLDGERFLTRFINLPFGTRVVCWARKPAVVTERVTVPAWERQWAGNPLPQGSG
jgi:ubiquinone/menaquinone biosynthesis C-methylase UbiE